MMPSPPCRAIATAIRTSVTVSIGDDISGTFTVIRLETRDAGVHLRRDDVALSRLEQHVVEGQAQMLVERAGTPGTEAQSSSSGSRSEALEGFCRGTTTAQSFSPTVEARV